MFNAIVCWLPIREVFSVSMDSSALPRWNVKIVWLGHTRDPVLVSVDTMSDGLKLIETIVNERNRLDTEQSESEVDKLKQIIAEQGVRYAACQHELNSAQKTIYDLREQLIYAKSQIQELGQRLAECQRELKKFMGMEDPIIE
jgi:septal ring factor EnvC (AmiA/AmiB activator)